MSQDYWRGNFRFSSLLLYTLIDCNISISMVITPLSLCIWVELSPAGAGGHKRGPRRDPGEPQTRETLGAFVIDKLDLAIHIPPAMADDARSPAPTGTSLRRAMTSSDPPQLRQRSQGVRLASDAPPVPPGPGLRRRSSNFSDYSLNEARRSFQSSTDDLLLPRASRDAAALPAEQESSAWHSAPLAFALLPAVGGMLFKNGSSVITDIMLLGLAAIFLNWSVRLPWLVDNPSTLFESGTFVLMRWLGIGISRRRLFGRKRKRERTC